METTYYLEKDTSYFENVRMDIVEQLPRNISRVLEVGCGSGRTLSFLKKEWGCEWVGGVELTEEAARLSTDDLDMLIIGDIEKIELPIEKESLDAIMCPDVLEHLLDPWGTVLKLRELLKPGGTMIVSVPNIRNIKVLLPLIFHGKFEYTKAGILDKTHLRFFTKSSAMELLTNTGFSLVGVRSNGMEKGSKARLINRLTLGLFKPLFEFQYMLTGTKDGK